MFDKEFDIVIIGSGAGGGTVAKVLSSLCRDGVRIAVLEWGPRFSRQEFTGRELEMAAKLYFDSGGFMNQDKTMTLAFAKAYGGSTVVYTGTSLIIPKNTVASWGVKGLEWEDLRRRSEKYAQENNVHLQEADKLNDNNRLFKEACEKLGYRVEQFPINVKGCQGSGMCNLGCPNGAKMGTDQVQLPEAERNGVRVVTNCQVSHIEDRVCYGTVTDPGAGQPSLWVPGQYRIRAKIVVVAAGAVNSPALLMRSRLPVRLPALGRYFTCHPALIMIGQHDRSITNYWGHPKSFYSDEFAESKRFLLETCMYFPFVTAKSLIGFGRDHSEMMSRMDKLQMILVLALDVARAENRVKVDRRGNPIVEYTLSKDVLDSLFESMKVSARILFAAGARRVHAPSGKKFFIENSEQDRLDELLSRKKLNPGRVSISSAHLMGGCRMGEDPATSVTDEWGEVHGIPWLRVADASLFPQCAGINPYLTIMALADRVAEGIKARAGELLKD